MPSSAHPSLLLSSTFPITPQRSVFFKEKLHTSAVCGPDGPGDADAISISGNCQGFAHKCIFIHTKPFNLISGFADLELQLRFIGLVLGGFFLVAIGLTKQQWYLWEEVQVIRKYVCS